jgi:mannose/fructose/N-acetylgalactosamine-specific phosphotransferase system component IIB
LGKERKNIVKNLVLTRIDDRLIHGQVMTSWIKNRKAKQVVIVDDAVAADDYMIDVLEMAIPEDIAIGIFTKEDAVTFFSQGLDEPTILLVKEPGVLNYLKDAGIDIDEVDVGGMGAREDRSVLYKNISTSRQENEEFRKLVDKGVNVYIQVMPQNKPTDIREYLK